MIRKVLILIMILLISVVTVEAQEWAQIGADIEGEAAYDWSGHSVSLSSDGSILAIGTPYNDANGPNSGHVRVFKNISGTWTQIGADIDGDTEEDWFGFAVSLSSDGTTVAIGAPYNAGSGGPYSGHARVFKNISGTWTQVGEDFDGEEEQGLNGWSVSLNSDGSIVAIGARSQNGENGSNSGKVRIYQNISGTWSQIGADIDGEAVGDWSGHSVSLSSDGSIVAIGATRNNGSVGHVRVYQNLSGTWSQIGADIDGEFANDRFGHYVSLSSDGSILAIGALRHNGNSGHVRVYQNLSGTWSQIGADINGEATGDFSGISVSLSSDGSIVAIGASGNNGNGSDSGHARIYKNTSGEWIQVGTDIDGENANDESGYSVSLSSDGSIVAIGALRNSDYEYWSGHTRVFNNSLLSIPSFQQQDVFIYPNPTNGILSIRLLNALDSFGTNSDQKIIISDLNGKELIKKTSIKQSNIIDLSKLESGLYLISIQNNNGQFVRSKIIKQ